MPVIFTVLAHNNPIILSTAYCGTCTSFWHRSFRAGGCSELHKTGEISIYSDRCEHWKLKDNYKSTVENEIKELS